MSPRLRRALPWLVALVAIFPFLPALTAPFLAWDDAANFIENERWRGLTLDHLRWMWTTFHRGPYQPLAWMSLALDHALWGPSPTAMRAMNFALHGVATAAFYAVFTELARRAAPETKASDRAWAAGAAALSWGAHPLRAEAVCWITERREVLSGALYLLALWLYLRGEGRSRAAWAAFVAACLAKASALTLPLTLLALDAWPLRRLRADPRGVLAEKLPYLAVSLAVGLAALAGQAASGFLVGLEDSDLGRRGALAAHALAWYAAKTLWPAGLSPFVSIPADFGLASPRVALAAAAVVAAVAAAWSLRRRAPAVPVSLAHYALAIIPASGAATFGAQLVADRYSYLPGLGLSALVGAGTLAALRRPRARPAVAAASAILLAALVAASATQSRLWLSDEALWSRALEVDPHSTLARVNLASRLRARGREQEALAQEAALAKAGTAPSAALNNLGADALRRGRFDEAESLLRAALRAEPGSAAARRNLAAVANNRGLQLQSHGEAGRAAEEFQRALRQDPTWALPRYNLGNALNALGREAESTRAFDEATRLDPGLYEAWLNSANALARSGRLREALVRYDRALALRAGDPAASRNAAAVRAAFKAAAAR